MHVARPSAPGAATLWSSHRHLALSCCRDVKDHGQHHVDVLSPSDTYVGTSITTYSKLVLPNVPSLNPATAVPRHNGKASLQVLPPVQGQALPQVQVLPWCAGPQDPHLRCGHEEGRCGPVPRLHPPGQVSDWDEHAQVEGALCLRRMMLLAPPGHVCSSSRAGHCLPEWFSIFAWSSVRTHAGWLQAIARTSMKSPCLQWTRLALVSPIQRLGLSATLFHSDLMQTPTYRQWDSSYRRLRSF